MSDPAGNGASTRSPRRRAVVVGQSGRPLIELLSDVLADIGVRVDVDGEDERDGECDIPPDMVLVMVDRNDLAGPFGRARAIAGRAPVVAILPFQDERLARQATASGASACYSLDTPMERLKSGFFAWRDLP